MQQREDDSNIGGKKLTDMITALAERVDTCEQQCTTTPKLLEENLAAASAELSDGLQSKLQESGSSLEKKLSHILATELASWVRNIIATCAHWSSVSWRSMRCAESDAFDVITGP